MIAWCATMFGATAAIADSSTFNTLFFKPAIGKNSYLMLQSTDTLHKYQFQVGEFFSYGYRPLEVRSGGSRVQGVVDHTLVSDFIGAVSFLEWLQFGFDFPYAIIDEFRDPNAASTVSMQNKMGLSDLRFEIKARVLDQCAYPVGLAFIPFITVPTGKDDYYLGDPGITGGLKIAIDGRVHKNIKLTFNAGYQGGKKVQIQNVSLQHHLLLGGGIDAMFKHGVSVFAEINADASFSNLFSNKEDNPAEAMAGVKWDIKKTGVTVNAGFGNCLVCGVKGARARGVLGVSYRFNPPKYQQMDIDAENTCLMRFKKGMTPEAIYELKMKCPPNPADYQKGVHDDACPKYYELTAITDLINRCPPKPEDFVPGVTDEACRKVYNLNEFYTPEEIKNIYILQAADLNLRCPKDPSQFNPAIHDESCPKYYDLQEISAMATKCPANPKEYRPGEDDPGCPTYYTLKEQYPKEQRALIEKLFANIPECKEGDIISICSGEIKTFAPAYFDFNSVSLRYDTTQVLDQVIALINRTPWIKKLFVDGHADQRGTEPANEKISERRAQVVIKYMELHGVRSDVTLIPVAYGSKKPVAVGKSEADYAKNRRVVFTIAREGFVPQPTTPPPTTKKGKKEEPMKPAEELAPSQQPVPEQTEEAKPAKQTRPKKWR